MVKSVEGGVRRVCATLLIFSFLALKILPQLATTTICAADALCSVGLYAVFSPFPPGEKLERSWQDYTFRKSLLDVVLLAAARGLVLFSAYFFCTFLKPRLVLYWRRRQQRKKRREQALLLKKGALSHLSLSLNSTTTLVNKGSTEFLYLTSFVLFCSLGFVVTKACFYDYNEDAKLYSNFRGFGAVMMFINIGFAALHVFCAKTFDMMATRRRRLQLVTTPTGTSARTASGLQGLAGGAGYYGGLGDHHSIKGAMLESLLVHSDSGHSMEDYGRHGYQGYQDAKHHVQKDLYDSNEWADYRGPHPVPGGSHSSEYGLGISATGEGSQTHEEQFNYTSTDDYGSYGSHGSQDHLSDFGGSNDQGQGQGENSRWVQLTPHLSVHYQEFKSSPDDFSGGEDQEADTEAVLLLHGFYGNVSCWSDAAREVARKSGKRCVVWDRIGFGLSSRPLRGESLGDDHHLEDGGEAGAQGGTGGEEPKPQKQEGEKDLLVPYGSLSHASVALCLCRRLKITRAHVVAHDDAASVALLLASREKRESLARVLGPKDAGAGNLDVRSVCLLHPNTGGEVASKLMEHLITSNIKAAARRHLVRMEVEVALRRQCYRSSAIIPERMHFYKRPLHLNSWERALKYGIQATATRLAGGEDAGLAREVSQRSPEGGTGFRMLVATGAHDSVARPDEVGQLFKPQRVHVFQDCGHLSHEECPDQLVDLLVSFVS
ncbi:alpha/beta hydrolase [Chloropicon primus]|uniref:Alpha/beta hydrolase n=2 Tax=Chloropicon primus TaxID=1764295 RepID=A0A5B8MUN0_9CHLO|nr:alpha/beta hydrolase [Chloropicon primus]UPR03466.1 alpha/beta hydrolase [Chloropicon primus]|eukprot:QDZ24259.1 alpha/beta hydrolase [Chloropicon primus]